MTGARRVVTPYEGTGARPWEPGRPVDAPLCLHRTRVRAEWTDYNGHLSESCYLLVFGDASDAFFRYAGIDERYRAGGRSLYTAETHLHHLREAGEGDPLRLTLQVLGLDRKRLHLFHAMYLGEGDTLLATAEQLLLHVDTREGRVTPLDDDLFGRLRAVLAAHAPLPRPAAVGHVMGIPERR